VVHNSQQACLELSNMSVQM